MPKISGTCDEWVALDPQPLFADMIKLVHNGRAPGGLSWDALYLCGAMPDDLLTEYLHAEYFRVIYEKHICGFRMPDSSRDLEMYLGTESLDRWAETFGSKGERTELHGRDAYVLHPPDDERRMGYILVREFFLALPNTASRVLAVTIQFDSVIDADHRTTKPDPAEIDQFADAVAGALVALSA